MIFAETAITGRPEFLASSKFLAINHTFTEDTKAATPVEVTDGLGETRVGICLYDVDIDQNPNGAVVVSGIVDVSKLASGKSSGSDYYPTLIFVKSEEE